jgi:Septum formation
MDAVHEDLEPMSPASLLSTVGALLTVAGVGIAAASGNLVVGVPVAAVGVACFGVGAWLRRTERQGHWRSRALGYWLLILGLIFGFRQVTPLYRGEGSETAPVAAPSVVAGECIDADLEGVPCSEPHFGEVFYVTEYPLSAPFPQPQDRSFQRWKARNCHDRFARYVGVTVAESTYDLRVLLRPRSWSARRRPVLCAVANVDASPLTESVKGTAQ